MFKAGPFTIWHITGVAMAAAACMVVLAWIVREIYYAANPDKRPLKRKRRRRPD
jgi:hypothetical protein